MAIGYVSAFLVSVVAIVVPWSLMKMFGPNRFPVNGKTVLITGASQGMGLAVAKLLSSRGANIIIVARDQTKLGAALEQVKASSKSASQRHTTFSYDLTVPANNTELIQRATQWNHGEPPDIVWAIAGTSVPKLFLDASIDTLRSQMEINYWAAAYLAHASLQAWFGPHVESNADHTTAGPVKRTKVPAERDARHLIFTSSVAGFIGVAGYATYAPAKAALRSLADNLVSEINLYHGAFARLNDPPPEVCVHLVAPGSIDSPGKTAEDKVKHPVTFVLEKDDPIQSEAEVAAAAVKGLESGGYLIMTNWLAKLVRYGSLSGSRRNGWGVVDTLMSGIVNFAWLFIRPDMENTVWKWGRDNGVYGKQGRKS